MHPGTTDIEISGRTYSLVERTEGEHYTADLVSDEGKPYTVHCHHGSWTCTCPDQKYRRPSGGCKHVFELRRRQEERAREQAGEVFTTTHPPAPTPATALPPEQQQGEQARRQYQEQLTMPATETPARDVVNEARGLTNLTRPAPQQVTAATAQQTLAAVSSQSGRTQLCIALSKAQQVVGRLGHDARNEYHRYDYTSSEAIIEAAKAALGDNGLCLLPLEETLAGHAKEGEDRFELQCKFVLLHQSGESLPLVRHWPVCPEKGRPLDKATAAASTLCLSYLLRDLLLIPRVNPQDEVPRRDDHPAQQPTRAERPKKTAKTSPPPPKDGAELEERLRAFDARVAAAGKCQPGELFEVILSDAVQNGYPAEMVRWNEEQCRLAMEAAQHLARTMRPAPAATKA